MEFAAMLSLKKKKQNKTIINLKAFQVALVVKTHLPGQEMLETLVWSLSWEDPLEEEMTTHSSILAWKFHGQRSLVGYSPQGRKESDTTEATQSAHMLC